jgi:outer membrane protein OmpA-like peptidoglycan-associated protein
MSYLYDVPEPILGEPPVPAGPISAVKKGVELYKFARELFPKSVPFAGSSDIGRYTPHPSPPGSKVQKCTRWFRIATYLDQPIPQLSPPFGPPLPKKRFRDSSFYFKLEYEYDGSNLLSVRILPQEKGSSTLRFDKFDITFTGKDHSLPEDPVAVIRYYISGTWEHWRPFPYSNDRYKIEGELDVSADGSAKLNIRSDDNRVLADPMTDCPITPVTAPYVPVKKSYSLPILFRFNKDDVSETYARQMNDWVASWPCEIQEKVASGDITVHIEGFASRPGKPLYNLKLSRRRMKNVEEILKNLAGNFKCDPRAYGAYRPNLPGLLDVMGWIKRFLDPNKYDQAAVIWFEA